MVMRVACRHFHVSVYNQSNLIAPLIDVVKSIKHMYHALGGLLSDPKPPIHLALHNTQFESVLFLDGGLLCA